MAAAARPMGEPALTAIPSPKSRFIQQSIIYYIFLFDIYININIRVVLLEMGVLFVGDDQSEKSKDNS